MASTTALRLPWINVGFEPNPDDFKWELYNIRDDFSQANNLRTQISSGSCRARSTPRRGSITSIRSNSSMASRADPAIRPSLTRGRSEFAYHFVIFAY